MGWRSPNYVYSVKGAKKTKLLLKNYKLSDDIAFRFSEKKWSQWPLSSDKFADWLKDLDNSSQVVNLFMDYETFGEHQWEDSGIFSFMQKLPQDILKISTNGFVTPSEAIKKYPAMDEIDIENVVTWADNERDLSAWVGNSIQKNALKSVYKLENKVMATSDMKLVDNWRKLQTSDHFYYMCTKWFNDGDVHKYFNPYESPYDAFISYMNALKDLELRIDKQVMKKRTGKKQSKSSLSVQSE